MKEYKRRLIKFSNYSLCVTLPKAMLDKLDLGKGDEVSIAMKRGKIIISANEEGSSNEQEKVAPKRGKKSENWEPVPEINQ